ncbi:permease prefix domain 1-containing protein [Deinococcus frigens]|uniref:permease prefix domain 1-containing protein n=1 Tax=Deinococcus frigens TaxID=249403 RepID=UPI0004958B04|nr:permease prefix domain 1-containing protein [Deinococcus frigens]
MKGVDRYLMRATRGLWGQKKRDAQAELRGAVEDKIYRYRLSGLGEAEAERTALRDLGSPATIARDLNRIHTGPQIARITLLLGLTGLLSLQAVAQVQPIQTAYTPSYINTVCRVATPAELLTVTPAIQEQYRQQLARYGGAQAFLRRCRGGELPTVGSPLLKVSDVLAALKIGGIDLGIQADSTSATSTTPLILYTGTNHDAPGPLYQTTDIGGERYISTGDLIGFLTFATTQPLRLSGARNPVLQVGQAKLQLGTARAPLLRTNVVAGVILRGLGELNLPRPAEMAYGIDGGLPQPSAPHLSVPGQDGELFAVIQNFERLKDNSAEWLMVRERMDGTIPIAFQTVTPAPRLVTTLKELDAATARKENAVMVYRLNAADLRQVSLAQIPASQLHLTPRPGGN